MPATIDEEAADVVEKPGSSPSMMVGWHTGEQAKLVRALPI